MGKSKKKKRKAPAAKVRKQIACESSAYYYDPPPDEPGESGIAALLRDESEPANDPEKKLGWWARLWLHLG